MVIIKMNINWHHHHHHHHHRDISSAPITIRPLQCQLNDSYSAWTKDNDPMENDKLKIAC